MKIDRLLALGLSTGIAFVSLELMKTEAAQAKPIALTDLACIRIKGGLYQADKEDIILNREIYTSLMRSGVTMTGHHTDSEFACKLPSAKSAELDLEITIPSGDNGTMLLTFYLNGNQVVSEKVFSGKVTVIKESLIGRADAPYQVGGRRTLVVETTCLSGSGCSAIRFLKGNLNVVANPGAKE
jgi:hypothetical protein